VKRFVLIALGIHFAAGNLCLMQMAHAAMPMQTMGAEMETMMSHMEKCDHCVKVSTVSELPAERTDCAGGHCLMHASTGESFTQRGLAPVIAINTPSFLPVSSSSAAIPPQPHSTAPPGVILSTKTVVLRC
jgi:hypothetical protein